MEVSTKKVLISVISTIIEFALIAFTVVYFILIKQPHPGDIYFFLGIVLAILVLRQVADGLSSRVYRTHRLYNVEIPNLLNQFHDEVGTALGMDVRVAYFVYQRRRDCLLIPGRCEIELGKEERKVELKEGEGVAGYVFLYHNELSGLFHDLEIPSLGDYQPRLRQQNANLADKDIRWIYAQKVGFGEQCYGIISLDSVKDSWQDDESQMDLYGDMVRITRKYSRTITNLY